MRLKLTDQIKRLGKELESLQTKAEQVEIKKSAKLSTDTPFVIGGKYFFRTVTYFLTGMVVGKSDGFLILKDASWIADTGRFMSAINDGLLSEVEPVNCEVYLNAQSITDAFEWKHELPRKQK